MNTIVLGINPYINQLFLDITMIFLDIIKLIIVHCDQTNQSNPPKVEATITELKPVKQSVTYDTSTGTLHTAHCTLHTAHFC